MPTPLVYVAGRTDVKSPVKYLTVAIERDYEVPADAVVTPEVQEKTARLRKVFEVIEARTPTQRDADRRLFLSRPQDPVKRADFERHGWTSPLNAAGIRAFVDELEPGILDGTDTV